MALELVNKLPYDHPYRWDGREFGGVKLWQPSDLGASLAIWLDAEDTDSITLNGTTVSQWDDKSGNDQHVVQDTASAQPLYLPTGFNSRPTLYFDQTNDEMSCDVTNVSSQGDLFFGAAFQFLNSGLSWRPIVGHNTSSSSANSGTLFIQRRNTTSEIGPHDAGRTDTGSTFTVQVTDLFEFRIATVGRSGGTNGKNGTITVTATGPSQPTYITQASQSWTTSESTSRIQIGGRQQTETQWANAYISEVIVCNTDLSTEDRQKVEGYFAHKWDLTDKLPSDHPYKLIPPYVGIPIYDADAQAYFNRVEGPSGDNQTLEPEVKTAINDFVVGCKSDGIWDAIKSSAILAGARTLSGALQPLVGTAPTNFNFISSDYNRKTGLVGDGNTKYLNSNRANNADPQNSSHNAVYVTALDTITARGSALMAGGVTGTGSNNLGYSSTEPNSFFRNRSAFSSGVDGGQDVTGLFSTNRSNSSAYQYRFGGVTGTITQTSETPDSGDVLVFSRADGFATDARLSFYSIGEALDLAALDTRVSALMTALDGAIA